MRIFQSKTLISDSFTQSSRLDLAYLPKTDISVYRQLINSFISSEFSLHLLWFTDKCRSGSKVRYTYFIQSTITHYRLRNSTSIFTAELTAVYACLSRTPAKYFLLSDSLVPSSYLGPSFNQSYRSRHPANFSYSNVHIDNSLLPMDFLLQSLQFRTISNPLLAHLPQLTTFKITIASLFSPPGRPPSHPTYL